MAAGSIVVDLLMKTGSFETDTQRAGKALQQFKKEAIEAGKVAGQAISAFATGVTILVQQTAKANAEIARFAALSNTSTQSFQTLAAGAKTAGIESDKLADIFKDVQDKVGDFMQTGGGPLADFFENIAPKVGVTADEFRRLSGPEALQLYVSSLEKANLSQSDMIFYMEAIASDASLLLPLLADGGKGFAEYADMAKRFGVVLGDDAMAAMNDFKKSNDVLALALKGFANQLTVALVPAFQNVVNAFANTETGAQNLKAAVDIAASGMKILISVGAIIIGVFKTVGEALGGLAAIVVNVLSLRFKQAWDVASMAAFDFADNVKQAVNAAGAAWDSYTPSTQNVMPVTSGRLSARVTKGGSAGKTEKNEAKKEADEWAKWIEEMEGATADRRTYIHNKMLDDMEKREREYEEWMTDMRQGELDHYAKMLNKKTEEMDGFAKQAAENIQDQLGEGLYNIMQGNFSDIGNSFKQMLDRMVAEAMAAKIARAMFGDMVEGGEGEGFFGGFLKTIGSTLFGGAKAGGGDTISGRAYLVGENGPEMFVPRTAGAIIPNDKMEPKQRTGNTIINVQAVQGMTRDTALQQGQRIAMGMRMAQARNG